MAEGSLGATAAGVGCELRLRRSAGLSTNRYVIAASDDRDQQHQAEVEHESAGPVPCQAPVAQLVDHRLLPEEDPVGPQAGGDEHAGTRAHERSGRRRARRPRSRAGERSPRPSRSASRQSRVGLRPGPSLQRDVNTTARTIAPARAGAVTRSRPLSHAAYSTASAIPIANQSAWIGNDILPDGAEMGEMAEGLRGEADGNHHDDRRQSRPHRPAATPAEREHPQREQRQAEVEDHLHAERPGRRDAEAPEARGRLVAGNRVLQEERVGEQLLEDGGEALVAERRRRSRRSPSRAAGCEAHGCESTT